MHSKQHFGHLHGVCSHLSVALQLVWFLKAVSAWTTAHSYACVLLSHAETHEGKECPNKLFPV